MKKHFVEFFSPGTFFSESTQKEIDCWDVDQAMEIANGIMERHGATPYGFHFITRGRSEHDLDSRVIDTSGMYYLGGEVQTLEEIEARKDSEDEILISNMKSNGWDRVIVNTNSYRTTQPFTAEDTILDWPS